MKTLFQDFHTTEQNIDYLTGLYNRRGLGEVWSMLPEDELIHCIYLDVDNFKLVNDIYGHAKGDRLLIFIGNLLKNTFKNQLVVRMGGDEFVVMCDKNMSVTHVEEKLPGLQEALRSGNFDKEVEKLLSFSIGVSYGQTVSWGLDKILEQSDIAMYRVKKSGKGGRVIYDEIRAQVEEENAIKERALSGKAEQEIQVFFRPVVHLQTSDVYAAEAVLKWDFPEWGVIPEERFLPVFRQYGIQGHVDKLMLEHVCAQKARWKDTVFQYLNIYVRFSGAYLMQKNSISHIMHCIRKYDIPLDEIKFCIEERDFWENGERLYGIVRMMIDAGFNVVIQDFASASSLQVLQRVASQTLKLDTKLLMEAERNETGLCILRNVISLGRDLNCEVVAQGIGSTRQIAMLANYGAQYGVGKYFGEPCLEEEFMQTYKDRVFFVRNRNPSVFRFDRALTDDEGKYSGVFSGSGYSFSDGVIAGQHSIHFPGGEVKENVLLLPKEAWYSDSYSICFWANPDVEQPWTSIIYVDYADGFMSLIPVSGHGDLFYRIKDDREANEWHDLICRQAVPGRWSYICATYDAVTQIAKLYFNGLLVASREHVPNMKVVNRIMIGGDEYQNSYEGRLADLEIYHYVISADEIEDKFRDYQRNETFLGTDGRK